MIKFNAYLPKVLIFFFHFELGTDPELEPDPIFFVFSWAVSGLQEKKSNPNPSSPLHFTSTDFFSNILLLIKNTYVCQRFNVTIIIFR